MLRVVFERKFRKTSGMEIVVWSAEEIKYRFVALAIFHVWKLFYLMSSAPDKMIGIFPTGSQVLSLSDTKVKSSRTSGA